MKPLALVTGASRGIGAAIAKKLAHDGYAVVINFVSNEAKALEVKSEIEASGGEAFHFQADVGQESEVIKLFEFMDALNRPLEVLVNNAGISEDQLILRLKAQSWDRILQTNLSSSLWCSREASKRMLKLRKGSIIMIGSVVGEMGNPGQVAYASAKAGMLGMMKSLAKELASRSIRVNAVTPGYIQTEMTGALSEAVQTGIKEQIPLGKMGSTNDVANAVSFLASDQAQYITGQTLGVNGGLYI